MKRLFTPGTKQHVISALGEILTRGGKERKEGKGAVRTRQRKETSRKLSRSAAATGE